VNAPIGVKAKGAKAASAEVSGEMVISLERSSSALAQNHELVQEALEYEHAFELFMRVMSVHSIPRAFLPFSCAMYENLSGLTARISRHQRCKPRRHSSPIELLNAA
jgi:hypothetical protein